MIFLLGCILIFFQTCYAFLHNNNHDYRTPFHVFQVFLLFCMNVNNLNSKSLHHDLMLFFLIMQIYFLLQDNAIFNHHQQSLTKILDCRIYDYILICVHALFFFSIVWRIKDIKSNCFIALFELFPVFWV